MVFPLAALGGAALSPLQGLGFGFGYGYGVRLGYHSFKPSKNQGITNMRLSPNPLTAGTGMGLASAEEMHDQKLPIGPLTDTPTAVATPEEETVWKTNKIGNTQRWTLIKQIGAKHGITDEYELWKKFYNGVYPFNKMAGKSTNLNSRARKFY